MPANDSPLWPILRLLVVGGVSIAAVSLGYQQGWVTRSDLPVVLSISAGLLGVDSLQKLTHSRKGR